MREKSEFISLEDAIDDAIHKLGAFSPTVKILHAVMEVMIHDDYDDEQAYALNELESLCR